MTSLPEQSNCLMDGGTHAAGPGGCPICVESIIQAYGAAYPTQAERRAYVAVLDPDGGLRCQGAARPLGRRLLRWEQLMTLASLVPPDAPAEAVNVHIEAVRASLRGPYVLVTLVRDFRIAARRALEMGMDAELLAEHVRSGLA